MSNRTTAELPKVCVCGRPKWHGIHAVPAPLAWWQRLLRLAWPRWVHGHTGDVHEFLDRAELGMARAQLRRLRRNMARERRKLGVAG